ncbi:helix-turn-helix domain-containing protein [Acinetobacter sp. ANC 3882]|uniref:winged helix-turn-helix transcriptional regulator n=1 Tax=Acinetobacter sp. ANC 3882 TaxID=2923423 RepID=UPI001F4B52ED|nr:helix-turn-helix domain-containing protein [Acinetobacter sp. ANC 3882]MCH7313110.1 helix-turn-helix transcriptional regulator [Acinetobacter sp. ANC 3882]
MKWKNVGKQPCSIGRSLSVLGDRWTLLVLRNAFMGVRRFDDFQAVLGVTRHVLSDRLKRLVDSNILKKVPYQGRQERFEYRLTEKGHELHPVLMALVTWGDKWMDEGRGPPIIYQHKSCGHQITPIFVCPECKEQITSRDVIPMAGPGLIFEGEDSEDENSTNAG